MLNKCTIAAMSKSEVEAAMYQDGLKTYELDLLANRFAELNNVKLDDPYHGPKCYHGGGFSGK